LSDKVVDFGIIASQHAQLEANKRVNVVIHAFSEKPPVKQRHQRFEEDSPIAIFLEWKEDGGF
jgi:hypothetical protein